MIYRIKIADRIFVVEIANLQDRPIIALVDGESIEVWPEDTPSSSPSPVASTPSAKKLPPAAASIPVAKQNGNADKVLAPIPGVIVSIAVQPNAEVTFGQELCVLEAMKMKNAIRATRAGRIASIYVSIGQQVKHHDVLMDYIES
ncbi:MAG: acetyl-CoA carboxylase biotin carboxyl carrier protein subunit [Chloroflexi bacterium]|nr:acetyl-CoA carboxylase biotin carboxyl carrier protein subunit [Chloroflexota bacterium]